MTPNLLGTPLPVHPITPSAIWAPLRTGVTASDTAISSTELSPGHPTIQALLDTGDAVRPPANGLILIEAWAAHIKSTGQDPNDVAVSFTLYGWPSLRIPKRTLSSSDWYMTGPQKETIPGMGMVLVTGTFTIGQLSSGYHPLLNVDGELLPTALYDEFNFADTWTITTQIVPATVRNTTNGAALLSVDTQGFEYLYFEMVDAEIGLTNGIDMLEVAYGAAA